MVCRAGTTPICSDPKPAIAKAEMETQKSSVQAQTRDVRTDHARGAAVARRDGALVLALMRHIARGAECRLWSVADLRSHRACVAGGARADRKHARPWCKRQLFHARGRKLGSLQGIFMAPR